MRYRGLVYRALNPVYTREPMSGHGAALYGGRFNPKGIAALYTSLSVVTALREANQVGTLQPTTLVAYEADIDGIFDSRDETALSELSMNSAGLADSAWREAMRTAGEAPTQKLARTLITRGCPAMLVRSFARGAPADEMNLVLWRWNDTARSRLTLIDDENRLSR